MSTVLQLEFFKSEEEVRLENLERRMDKCEESCGKVRRGLFARNGDLTKVVNEMNERLTIIERAICGK